LPALYVLGASVVMVVLLFYRTQTTWPGLLIVLAGVPVYFLWKPTNKARAIP
jgi:APA family basic amino acid/polyamine antiporter